MENHPEWFAKFSATDRDNAIIGTAFMGRD